MWFLSLRLVAKGAQGHVPPSPFTPESWGYRGGGHTIYDKKKKKMIKGKEGNENERKKEKRGENWHEI